MISSLYAKPQDMQIPGALYEINLDKESTAENFNYVDIAISPMSTVLYERLFCGFKSLIGCYLSFK